MTILKFIPKIMAVGAATALMAGPAFADHHEDQTFTWQSKNETPVNIGGVRPDGGRFGAAYWKGTSTGTASDGQEISSNFSCISMTQPPKDSIFMAHMMCDVAAPDGKWIAVMGCQFLNADGSDVSCVGGMYGQSGAYAGRGGTITSHGVGNSASGTGQWFK